MLNESHSVTASSVLASQTKKLYITGGLVENTMRQDKRKLRAQQ